MGDKIEKVEEVSTEEQIEEGSAADTLRPGGAPGETKSEMMATFAALLAQLGKEDLSDLFNRTLEQIGQEAALIPNGAAAQNAASISAKTVKEDLSEMFAGDELSEDFRERISVLFEAALNIRATLEESRLQEEFEEAIQTVQSEYDERLQEESARIFDEVTEKLDQYIDYTVETWMEENKMAVESSLRSEIAEDFIQGLHNLFSEHYITVPDQKLDIVAEMKAELEEVRTQLNTVLDDKIQLESKIAVASKDALIEDAITGLVVLDAEKVRTLAENIEYTDVDSFARKLELIKENYVNKKPSSATGMIVEEIAGSEDGASELADVPAHMQAYVKSISKSAK